MAVLNNKVCLLLAEDNTLSRAVVKTLTNAGADVTSLAILEVTEKAWQVGLLDSSARPPKIDVIINDCIPRSGGAVGTATLKDYRSVIEASYVRTYLALKYGIQALRASGGGAFINVTSADGVYGAANAAPRCSAANGIMQLTRATAIECAATEDNVRVNALLVGDIIQSDQLKYAPGHVSPNDVAEAVAHLAADAAVYITGLLMHVDNGGGLAL